MRQNDLQSEVNNDGKKTVQTEDKKKTKAKRSRGVVVYMIIRFFVWLFYPKIKVVGAENLPEEGCMVIGNHSQMNGPIAMELYFPGKRMIWCVGEMMNMKEAPDYAFRDFWSDKPGWIRWFYRILSYIIAPLSYCIFNNAHCIGVYHDKRSIFTFRDTLKYLKNGYRVIVFPEEKKEYNRILYEFQDGFADIARLHYKREHQPLSFVPMYLAPRLKTMFLGEPVTYDPGNNWEVEKVRIKETLMERITKMAEELPRHRVVPYANLPKKQYPYNRDE